MTNYYEKVIEAGGSEHFAKQNCLSSNKDSLVVKK